jgi:hypothetical protein
MTRIIVRWWPPYSNGYKDQPCELDRAALEMAGWFASIGVCASVIRLTETETLVVTGDEAWSSRNLQQQKPRMT